MQMGTLAPPDRHISVPKPGVPVLAVPRSARRWVARAADRAEGACPRLWYSSSPRQPAVASFGSSGISWESCFSWPRRIP